MSDTRDDRLELVRKAISLFDCSGCYYWNPNALKRVSEELPRALVAGLRKTAYEFVCNGGKISEIEETRPGYEFRHYYKIILPVPEFVHGVFIEMRLTDDDPDCPSVEIVNAHEQRR